MFYGRDFRNKFKLCGILVGVNGLSLFLCRHLNYAFLLKKKKRKIRQQQYNSLITVNKTSDPRVSNYEHLHVRYRLRHIFGKHEIKADHEIEKSIWYFNFLLLPQPFQFFIFLLNLLCKLIIYEMVKFVLD